MPHALPLCLTVMPLPPPAHRDDAASTSFQSSWFESHSNWLEYSPSTDSIYCLPCYLFRKKPTGRHGSDAFTEKGFNNWKKVKDGVNCSLIGHEGKEPDTPHKIAEKCCEDLLNYSGHIDKLVEQQTSKEMENNRLQLKTSIECARWLAFQACAFRGHDEILDSKNSSKVRNAIREEIGDAKFFILVDEARDESKREQMATILRFVDKEDFIKERFFYVVHVRDTTALTLKNEKCVVLSHYNLHIENILGQGYDGASNMRALQQHSQDLLNAMHLVSTTKSLIQKLRDDRWEPLLASVISFCEQHEIDIPDMYARYTKARDFTEQEQELLEFQLQHYELNVIKDPDFQNMSTISELCRGLKISGKSKIYFLIDRLIRLVLTLLVSTATTKRVFSAMKLLKTRLRNRMKDELLADNMIVYIEKEIAGNFTAEMIMDEFYSMKNRYQA
ncbi:hypothetical protein SO802_003514 [Lithocarpus litseifolius]|uniref:TTF-type domain-containing protein n=1 Tax=Lithocarpus litseifolius TaxID=425828 RepID=A0AAW2E493_9ROSI